MPKLLSALPVSLATRYGLDGPRTNSGGGEIYHNLSDQPRGPASLLQNEYRVFAGGKATGAWS